VKEKLKKDIVIWDVKTWYKAIVYWDKNIDWNKVQNCLELGGREGGLSLWLALKGKNTICSDLQDVKQSAEELHQKYKVNSLIKYQDIDATNIPYDSFFDVIVFKSVIGGVGRHNDIQQQQKAFSEIYKALKPGGKLLFAENLIASPFHQKMREKYVNWGSSWRYVSIAEMQDFLKPFSSYTLKTTGVLATFGRNENQRQFFASIDELILNKICPKEWQYICYGIAEK
jgi:SAM-dependent methyltransferase